MRLTRTVIVALLHARGDHDTALFAERGLPGTVDTHRDQHLLDRFGLRESDLTELSGTR